MAGSLFLSQPIRTTVKCRATGYLTQGIEHVELEDLEGAQGLRALRVTVDMQEALEQLGVLDDVAETVRLLVH